MDGNIVTHLKAFETKGDRSTPTEAGSCVGVSFTPFYQYEYYWLNGIFWSSGTTSYVRYLVPYLTGTYRQTVGNKVSGRQ